MGRVARNTVNYLSIDCDFFQKEKMVRVECSLGELAKYRSLDLLLWMGRTEGFFIELNDMTSFLFAKNVICNVQATQEVSALICKLVEIGFFVRYQDSDGKTYLSSPEIIRDWKNIMKNAKRIPNLESIPDCFKPLIFDEEKIDSEGKGIDSEGKGIDSESIPQRKEKKSTKQTNKQANFRECFFAEDFSKPNWEPVRESVTCLLWNRGISSDLVDMATAAVLRGWVNLDDVRRIRALADAKVSRCKESNGRLGNDVHAWQGIAEQVFALYRENGEDPPPCSSKRLEPKPETARRAPNDGHEKKTEREESGEELRKTLDGFVFVDGEDRETTVKRVAEHFGVPAMEARAKMCVLRSVWERTKGKLGT